MICKLMTEQQPKELTHASQLMREGKYKKALETIINFEKEGAFTPREQLSALLLKGRIYSRNHQYEDAVKVAELAYQVSQKLGIVSESISALILEAQTVFLGKFEKALQVISEAEKLLNSLPEDSSPNVSRQRVNILYMKAWIFYFTGVLNEGLEIALQCLALRKKTGNRIGVSYTLILIGYIYWQKGENLEALDYAKKGLEIQEELNNQVGVARSHALIGFIYYSMGDLDLALKSSKQGLSVTEISGRTKIDILQIQGDIYREKGELDSALNYFKQSISLADELNINDLYVFNLMNIGSIYRIKGDYDLAIKYLTRSLVFIDHPLVMIRSLLWLILINLDKNSRDQAQQYLSRLKALKDQTESKLFTHSYHLAEAMVLKASGRASHRARAEILLKEIAKDDITILEIHILSQVSLCDFLLEELYVSNDLEILDEIKPVITRLLNIAEEQKSFLYLAETKLLQAKLALIQMEIDNAKQLLIQAQNIAEEHGLHLLAQKISSEHDTLLEQLNIWEELEKRDAPISERLKLASLDGVIDRIQGKRALEPPELVNEESVVILIMAIGGIPIFSYPFSDEWKRDNELFGSFLSAFTSFSDEFFSEGFDRAKFGQYTVLLKPVADFSVCYLFKGQTYPASQKITKFSEDIQTNTSIWQSLNQHYQMSQVLEINDLPPLKNLLTDIFLSKNSE